MTRSVGRRQAFTLVELLVAVAVIGTLAGLLLPAVQKVRAAAARLSCQNNLKQLGLAAQNYHAAHHYLPPGVTPRVSGEPHKLMAWPARLLPFLEQDSLWAATAAAYAQQPNNPFDRSHVGFSTPVKLFACPADDRLTRPHLAGSGYYAALTSYQGSNGTAFPAADGVYYYGSATRLTDVADGTSTTLAIGERPPGPDYNYGWWYASMVGGRQGGWVVLGASELRAPNDTNSAGCSPGPYAFGPGSLTEPCDVFHFWSLHAGGANFALCDASVRFLRYDAKILLPALATRAGGEVVGSLD